MINDIRTVLWKELRDSQLRVRRGAADSGRTGGALALVFYVFVLGVIVPSSTAPDWIGVPAIAVAAAAAAMIVITTVPDSFAGERDRHTLETLLASRLPDRAILVGKIVAAAALGMVLAVLVLAVSLLTANAADHRAGFEMYSALDVLGALLAALLTGVLAANLGVMVSLRASSATAAARALTLGMFGIIFGATALFATLPRSWRADLERAATEAGLDNAFVLLVLGTAVLVLVNAGLLAVSSRLFRRPKLIRP